MGFGREADGADEVVEGDVGGEFEEGDVVDDPLRVVVRMHNDLRDVDLSLLALALARIDVAHNRFNLSRVDVEVSKRIKWRV